MTLSLFATKNLAGDILFVLFCAYLLYILLNVFTLLVENIVFLFPVWVITILGCWYSWLFILLRMFFCRLWIAFSGLFRDVR